MNVLFVGKTSTFKTANAILEKTGQNPGFQIIKFINLITDGFRTHNINLSIISNVRASSIGIKTEIENGISYQYIFTHRIPILSQLLYYAQSFYHTMKWGLKNKKDSIVFCDIFSSSSSISGSVLAAKILRIPICGLVTDMITTPLTTTLNTQHVFWKLFFKIRKKRLHQSLKEYNSFVFVTAQMAQIYNLLQRPYIIMEGSVDSTFIPARNSRKDSPRVIMYAGAIEAEYGFHELTKAFMSLKTPNIELHVYGNGKFVKELLEYQKKDSRIKYMGVVNNQQIVEAEQKATLLVNPRLSHEEYVKYSFPSKTSEYMLSGTPLLTTRLGGIPQEYFQHVYVFEDESVAGYAKTLEEVLSYPQKELDKKGKEAQAFMLNSKNNIIQSKRIIDLFAKVIK
jgi:glycosyltransferase involved in cell wall biosynthesis